MKRRNFLGLFGGAIAAPLMPLPALATAQAGYSQAAMHGAILHAQTHSAFSIWNLAKTLNLPIAQAEALMGDMAKRGIVGPLQGATFGGRWATSNVLLRDTLAASKAVQQAKTKTPEFNTHSQAEGDLSTMIAHLRKVCIDYGMPLHPRCALT